LDGMEISGYTPCRPSRRRDESESQTGIIANELFPCGSLIGSDPRGLVIPQGMLTSD
jgi:hypothetical protein